MSDNRAAHAEKFRSIYPQTAAIVDEIRRVFGEGAKVNFAKDCSVEMGKRWDEGVLPVLPLKVKKCGN